MSLSIYVHIPYCIQRCRYCDFTTFEQSQILPPEEYIQWLLKEIRFRHLGVPSKNLRSLYFGGGTPSLLEPRHILSIMNELANVGFEMNSNCEITIEINPATMDQKKLDSYLDMGINRFSVGAQSFNDEFLKNCGRRHSAQDTRETLKMLENRNLNYSFDLLFALPHQSLFQLEADVLEALKFHPRHMSLYCLTVPDGHPMSFGRAPEGEQLEMFDCIDQELRQVGFRKYEISNYALPGYESKHNWAYWKDQDYWGLGLSAHSYFTQDPWGLRFWNPKKFEEYFSQLKREVAHPTQALEDSQVERLKPHEALTDLCHMHLRTFEGLPKDAVRNRFSQEVFEEVAKRFLDLQEGGFISESLTAWVLTSQGERLLNQVLLELTFTDLLLEPPKALSTR